MTAEAGTSDGWRRRLSGVMSAITPQNSQDAAKAIGVLWLGAVLLHGATLFFIESAKYAFNTGLMVAVLGGFPGYFLYSRASRIVAIWLALYTAISILDAFSTNYGWTAHLATGVIAIVLVLLTWRALAAAFVFQRSRKTRIRWRRVALIALATGLAAVAAAIAVTTIKHALGVTIRTAFVDSVVAGSVLFIVTLTFAVLTHYWPLAIADEAQTIPNVFD